MLLGVWLQRPGGRVEGLDQNQETVQQPELEAPVPVLQLLSEGSGAVKKIQNGASLWSHLGSLVWPWGHVKTHSDTLRRLLSEEGMLSRSSLSTTQMYLDPGRLEIRGISSG